MWHQWRGSSTRPWNRMITTQQATGFRHCLRVSQGQYFHSLLRRKESDVQVTVHRDKFFIIKPTRCTNFSNLFLEYKSTCFGQFLCPSTGVFHWSHSQAVSKSVWHIPLLCVQWKTPDDGERNCPKHVEFYSKNKFEKLVHLVGFITDEEGIMYTATTTHLYTSILN